MQGGFDAGARLGDFEIIEVAGRGGMGVVYRARQLTLERVVALKVISPEVSGAPDFTDRFRRESRLAASIDHPHVVSIFGAGELEGQPYISMQWIDGVSLDDVLADRVPLPEERTRAIISQIAAALDVAHSTGLVHRDVKPPNILVRSIGGADHAYLTDFGIARRVDLAATGLTKTGQTVGTVGYMAPEQIRGEKGDGRSDLYSLGCVLYQCLTGRRPFEHDTEVAVMFAHVNEQRPRPSALRPELAGFDELITRALALEPENRFQTGAELRSALATVSESSRPAPVVAATAPSATPQADETRTGKTAVVDQPPPPPPPPRSRPYEPDAAPQGRDGGGRRWLIGLGIAALIAAVGVGAFAAAGGFDGDEGTMPMISNDDPDTGGDEDPDGGGGGDAGGGGGGGGLGDAGESNEAAEIKAIQATLDKYQAAFSAQDSVALAATFTDDVFRRGIGPDGSCDESGGVDDVIPIYETQFASGTGTYTLTDTSAGAIDVDGDLAKIETGYTIEPGSGGSISFELARSGRRWLISEIFASC